MSAMGDRADEHGARRRREPCALRARQPAGAPARPHPRPEQDLVHVDVAEARDLALVHQERLDRGPAVAPRARVQEVGGELVGQRVQARNGLRADGVARDDRQTAEAADRCR
jgi:hypothetical protein